MDVKIIAIIVVNKIKFDINFKIMYLFMSTPIYRMYYIRIMLYGFDRDLIYIGLSLILIGISLIIVAKRFDKMMVKIF